MLTLILSFSNKKFNEGESLLDRFKEVSSGFISKCIQQNKNLRPTSEISFRDFRFPSSFLVRAFKIASDSISKKTVWLEFNMCVQLWNMYVLVIRKCISLIRCLT